MNAVLVSPFSMYRYDPSYVLEVVAKHPERFCLVKPVDPNDPAVADGIADWKGKKGTVGIRVLMRDDVSTDPADPGINRVLAAAAKHSLAVNLACSGRLEQVGQMAARNPDARLKSHENSNLYSKMRVYDGESSVERGVDDR